MMIISSVKWILKLACFVVMITMVTGCHVIPEKLVTREDLCQGPMLMLPDVGMCGTLFPKFIEDLAFKIFFPWAETWKTYILIMVDPDAPMREYPLLADYVHWLLADIPGVDFLKGTVSPLRSKELVPYRSPSPPPGSGYHRYQLFLFESPEDATAADIIGYSPFNRPNFNLTNFVVANNLCFHFRASFEFSHEQGKYVMNRFWQARAK